MGLPGKGDKPTNRDDKDELVEDAAQEDQVRLNADVPKSLRKRIQIQAAKEERNIRDVVIDAMEGYLSEHS
ncbi:hypothetical protein GGP72_003292 [Salinibacter ruber]|jgi:hypothetical protein|uniref:Uncharacterized protein n=1 Tax=Salinibacter ruber TaxID=146919 RepID=A0A9X2PYM6_9BACT|nr:hypothetical protein [Salinibacter ruber]MCS3682628.1 hypothetical protein [Salinibacter ruber]